MDGQSTDNPCLMNSLCNMVANGIIKMDNYSLGVMYETGLISFEDQVLCIIVYNSTNSAYGVYAVAGGTIRLPAEALISGVDAVAVDNADETGPVEYYNLQGVKVDNPSRGFYILRQGSKATKILIK